MEIPGQLFDGQTTRAQPARLRITGKHVEVVYEEGTKAFSRSDVIVRERLGNSPRVIEFPGLWRFETEHNDLADQLLGWGSGQWLHRIESKWSVVAAGVLIIVATLLLGYWFALPRLSHDLAMRLPQSWLDAVSKRAEEMFDGGKNEALLSEEERGRVDAAIAKVKVRFPAEHVKILVRQGDIRFGANAFALPNGTIVLTLELVELMLDEREILGVILHEMGHVHHRHGMQAIVKDMAVSLVLFTISGGADWSSFAGFLLSQSYSRKHEHDADLFAAGELKAMGLSPVVLADGLSRLERSRAQGGGPAFLSSHPLTAERVGYLKALAEP